MKYIEASPTILESSAAKVPWLSVHPLSKEDSAAVSALRSIVAPMKGKFEGTSARAPFDDIMKRVMAPDGMVFDVAKVGGISGWWAKPERARKVAAIIHVHGGWFRGTARAFRNLAGQIPTERSRIPGRARIDETSSRLLSSHCD